MTIMIIGLLVILASVVGLTVLSLSLVRTMKTLIKNLIEKYDEKK